MLQRTGRARTHEYGVSEVIGAVMLVAVVAAAVVIISVAVLSQPPPEKLPALEAVISNTGNTVQILHNGGDTLQYTDFKVLIDGNEVTPPSSVSDTAWSSGETLTFDAPGAKTVQILYTKGGGTASAVMSSANFGAVSGSSTSMNIMAGAGTGGSISPSGAVAVVYGGSQAFSIAPDIGYRITDVKVDGVSVGAVTTYTFSAVTSNHAIYAAFAKNPEITATASDHGSIVPSGTVSVTYTGNQMFAILADSGYRVQDVLVDSVSQGALTNYTFTNVLTDHTISASFALNPVITATSGANGTVTPAGETSVSYGGSQTYTITPNTGYRVSDVLVDSVSQGALTNYTFTNVAANHTISATFAINAYTITATSGANGTVTPAGTTTISYGGSQVYAITPNTGYRVSDVLVDSVSQGALTNYTFTNVAANHTISATFVINTYTITATSGANGTVTPAGTITVSYGGSQVYAITPNTGYRVSDVLVDSLSQGALTNYTFTNVVANHTISATFVINTYTITATSGANGTVTPAGTTTVSYGGSQVYAITPNTGYHIAGVLVDGISNGTISGYTFTNVAANHTISATFAINQYTINATAGSNGSITPGNMTVNYGGSQAYTITPNTGYHIAGVLVDGISNGTISGYTFTNVVANHTISATFAINRYNINATSNGNGTVLPGNVTVNYGGSQAYTITPNTGYRVSDVVVDSVSQGALTNYNFTNVVANHTIAVTFGMIPPVANFTATPQTGGVPLTVTFNDTSTNNPTSWVWNFGDPYNTTSYEKNPTHTYFLPGNYSVELWATNDGGTGYFNRSGYIFTYYPANANFTADVTEGPYGLSGLTVQFTDHSTGGVSSWDWDFGDGSYSESNTHQNPGHTYAEGLYSVNLSVANTFSSSYLLRENYINVTPNPPSTDFETYDNDVDMNPLDHGGAPLSVFFYDLSSNSPTSWTWNFGDGNVTSITKDGSHEYADIYHTFTSPGSYNVSLTAYNAWGSSTAYRTITVYPAPTITGLSPTAGPVSGGQTVTITGTNFVGVRSVTFGGTANATGALTVNSATSITVTTPSHTAGTVDVVVSTTNGSVTASNSYRYAGIPTYTSLSPSPGPLTGGQSVTIIGTNMTGANYVTFGGGANVTGGLTVNSDTSITVTTPTYTSAGAVNVVITTPGGSVTAVSAYRYYVIQLFNSSTTWAVPSNVRYIDYLVVAGGGGGGRYGGGGGGGGALTGTGLDISSAGSSISVTVGSGGTAGTNSGTGRGGNGSASSFGTLVTATGGGGGGSRYTSTAAYRYGLPGGSGGGGVQSGYTGGTGTSGQGYDGGDGARTSSYTGGGGGGAGSVGSDASTSAGGAGGSGITSSLSGASATFACGGGGGAASGSGRSAGAAGCSIAGAGSTGSATSVTTNYGGGGGGGGSTGNGGSGGAGIIIIRYY